MDVPLATTNNYLSSYLVHRNQQPIPKTANPEFSRSILKIRLFLTKHTRLVKLIIGQKFCEYPDSQFWNWLVDLVSQSRINKSSVWAGLKFKNEYFVYRTRAIISHGLYTFSPHFQRPFMYCDLWRYVWLVFKSGFWSRAAYDGARTVHKIFIFEL